MYFEKYTWYVLSMKPRFIGTEKKCTRCHTVLPIENFYVTKKTKVYASRCKKCELEYHTERFSASYKRRSITLFHGAKSGSKRRKIPFQITKNDIIYQYEKQNGKCYYSGRNLSSVTGDENIMSIDRINSDLGYTPDNIVICCWKVNKMKNTFTSSDFLSLCKDICHFSENRKF